MPLGARAARPGWRRAPRLVARKSRGEGSGPVFGFKLDEPSASSSVMSVGVTGREPPTPEAETASSFPQNALDLADGNPIDLGNLRNGHAAFQPSSNSSEVGRRDLGRHRRLGVAGSFGLGMPDRRRRRSGQDPRFPLRRLGRGAGVRNRKLGVLPFWPEQRLRGCNGTTEKRDTVSKQSGAGGGKSHPIALRPKR